MTRRVTLPAFALVLAALGGCGPSYHPVSGVVKLDGTPVDGATVTLVSDDGIKTYTGFTGADGTFTIASGPKPGAIAGTYKVTVVKHAKVEGGENMTPGGADYMKHMQKDAKIDKKAVGPMPGVMPGTKAGSKGDPDNLLPQVYSSTTSTPLTAKVPVDGGQLVLDLKKK